LLLQLDIPFETERELKKRGTSKTPDVLFLCPVAVKVRKRNLKRTQSSIIQNDELDYEWKMINWIDSKVCL
jgi:hypothetical protein